MARDNRTLGKFHLVGIPPAPRGVPQIEVTFDIDANGIVNVMAKDLATNKEQKITITASSGLTKDEIDKMRKDADSHSDEDRKRRDEVEAKNKADSLVYQTEKLLKENREKLPDADARNIESAIEDCKKAIDDGGLERINKAVEQLTNASHKLADVLYRQAGTQGAASAGPTPGAASGGAGPSSAGPSSKPAEGEVIDAEYVDMDDKKN